MINKTMLTLLVALMMPLSLEATAEDGASLQWKFPAGRKLNIVMTQQMRNAQELGGQEMATDMSTTSYMTWEVAEVDESGVATINSTIDRMTMNMKSPQGEFEIDSDAKQELTGMAKVVGETLIGMVGKPFGQTMNTRGQVLTVDFPAEFEKASMVMGKDAMEKLIKNASPTFPDKPIAVGETWDQETTTGMPNGLGEMRLQSTYTYQGTESVDGKMLDIIGIGMKVDFVTSDDSPASIEVTDQNTNGKMYFDSANGHTAMMKVEQKMAMTITMGAQKINQKIENNTEGTFSLAE